MVASIQQVNVEQVYAGGEDPVPQPQPPVAEEGGDKAFLNSLDLDNSYWYKQSTDSIRGQIRQLLLFYKDVFMTLIKRWDSPNTGSRFALNFYRVPNRSSHGIEVLNLLKLKVSSNS